MKTKLLRCIAYLLVAVIIFSGYQLWRINRNYAQEAAMHNHVLQFRPQISFALPVQEDSTSQHASIHPDNLANTDGSTQHDTAQLDGLIYLDGTAQHDSPAQQVAVPPSSNPATTSINQEVADLRATYQSAVGWLAIPNTLIDYPFVQGTDNDFYLHMDLNHNRSQAGTVFMDYRNNSDFTDFNTIIFGHNMKNGSMFGTLQNFNSPEFFHNNRVGVVVLENKKFVIEFFAFAVIKPNDPIIYNPSITSEVDKTAFLEYVQNNARHYRDIAVTPENQVITLSTCSYEFNNARMVLIGRIVS